jgi:hypothetical protein
MIGTFQRVVIGEGLSFMATLGHVARSFHVSLFSITILMFFAIAANAAPTVTVLAPKAGAAGGSPIFYEAYATSSGCSKGISAMRIYTAPGVSAVTVTGDHLETFLKLKGGSYSTTVQAWDNCGGVAKAVVAIKVTATAGVTVYLPSGKSAVSPVHIAASAQNAACAKGIAAMRIYTGPGVGPYTVNAAQLDAYVSLPAKGYSAAVQAWDNCGHVFKSPITLSVSASPDRALYSSYGGGAKTSGDLTIARLDIGANGDITNANGSGDPPQTPASGAGSLVTDPGGWFLYVSDNTKIYGFQINPVNNTLLPIHGSPFPAPEANAIAMDPSGNFLYCVTDKVSTFRIDRSTGALSPTNKSAAIPQFAGQFTLSGPYFYLLGSSLPFQIIGYKLDANSGALTSVPGSPYKSPGSSQQQLVLLTASNQYLFAGTAISSNDEINGNVFTYVINAGNGELTPISRPPLLPPSENQELSNIWADNQGKFVWIWWQDTDGPNSELATYDVESDGSLVPTGFSLQPPYESAFTDFIEEDNGTHIFTFWQDTQQTGMAFWDIRDGDLTLMDHAAVLQTFPAFADFATQNTEVLVRKQPN